MYGYTDRHDHWEIEGQLNDVKRDLSSLKYNHESEYRALEYRISDLEYALQSIQDRLYNLEAKP
jgi:hypothetical protein